MWQNTVQTAANLEFKQVNGWLCKVECVLEHGHWMDCTVYIV